MLTLGDPIDTVGHILTVFSELRKLKGVEAVLDRLLCEARWLAKADAGTIFMVKNDRLVFSLVHNDSLFSANEVNKNFYLNADMPIDDTSIAGYVAKRGEAVQIDDAYDIDPAYPFRFNTAFDVKTGYRTRSVLSLPIKNSREKIIAVIQIINSLDEERNPVPFSKESHAYVSLLAHHAGTAIENAVITSELVLRMMKMAELRDPSETGAHVQRVGAYSAEIYHKLALNRGVCTEELKRTKDLIRVASMLHDVGKVGVSDLILKKPAKLTDEEYEVMKMHTIYGGQLFANAASELDALAGEIALNHHMHFGGGGYPGKITDFENPKMPGPPMRGDEIPLPARITALADVFDALTARRVYKPAWPDEKALDLITSESGKQFDPEVVDAFLAVIDVITAIREKFIEPGVAAKAADKPETAP
ncbi:MAG: HD domain-containing protein [Desulfovibrionaceae bacterium]|nr:HD domain-containing protein [Desulfovibrionaceae bacterium]MBF0515223.1 HD domain-containing protein [Desulfovibrionaceae bacterium]